MCKVLFVLRVEVSVFYRPANYFISSQSFSTSDLAKKSFTEQELVDDLRRTSCDVIGSVGGALEVFETGEPFLEPLDRDLGQVDFGYAGSRIGVFSMEASVSRMRLAAPSMWTVWTTSEKTPAIVATSLDAAPVGPVVHRKLPFANMANTQ